MMFRPNTYIKRREALISLMSKPLMSKCKGVEGIVIIPSNLNVPNSYPNNSYYFRQDSSFRYLFGLNAPSLVGIIDLDSGESALYGDNPTLDDLIWTGRLPNIEELSNECGVSICGTIKGIGEKSLKESIAKAQRAGRTIHLLPPYRGETKLQLAELLGCSPFELKPFHSADLIFAMAELREVKSEEEIEEIEKAYKIGYMMHTTAMRLTRAGVTEREVSGELEGIARRYGAGVSFPTIYTQHGEILHNISQEGVLTDGKLVLCDAGAESLSGYCSDHTRTYPVGGKFSSIQRDIYNIVLSSHNHVAQIAKAGMMYQDLHQEAYRKLAEGLLDFGLLRGSIDEVMESGAVRLFMPHGTSHGMGMDVHDCEAFGERSFDYSEYRERALASATAIFREGWRLRSGSVITNEPGIYFIAPLIEKSRREGLYSGVVDYDKALGMCDFGGIRIEDDLVIRDGGCVQVGEKCPIPKSIEKIEEFMEDRR